jgi:hypothetical protein
MSFTEHAGRHNLDPDDSGWVGAPADDDLDQRLAAEDEPVNERQPHVMTTLGPIPPAALGVTLFGTWGRPLLATGREPGAVLLELEQLYASGVRAVVDLTTTTSAQQVTDLNWISQRSPVHIVVGAQPEMSTMAANGDLHIGISLVESVLVPDSTARFDRPPFVRAETWSVVAQRAMPSGEVALDWAGWTVVAEAENATMGLVQPALAAGARGVLIVADGDAGRMTATAALICDLVEDGYGDRLSLGYNADPITVAERFPLFLMEAGLPAMAVRRILVDSPAEALTTQTRQV